MQPSHPHGTARTVGCAVVTVSDSRTPATDTSGQCIESLLRQAGHSVVAYHIVKDEPAQIVPLVRGLVQQAEIEAIILNGGTGIAPRDTTYEALLPLLSKQLPGFGEIFRQLSYGEIGSRAIASRAIAGVCENTLIFSLPGSSKAVKLATEALILPELSHLTSLLRPQ